MQCHINWISGCFLKENMTMLSLHIQQDNLCRYLVLSTEDVFIENWRKSEENISSVVEPAYLWRLSCCDSVVEVKKDHFSIDFLIITLRNEDSFHITCLIKELVITMSLDVPSYVPDDLWTHADLHLSEHQPLFWKMTALQQTSRMPFSLSSSIYSNLAASSSLPVVTFYPALDTFSWVSKS